MTTKTTTKTMSVKCAECGQTVKTRATKERPLVWKCNAQVEGDNGKPALCGATNIVEK